MSLVGFFIFLAFGFTYKSSKMVGSSALHVVGFYYNVFSFLVTNILQCDYSYTGEYPYILFPKIFLPLLSTFFE
jgi:hypothetical protein